MHELADTEPRACRHELGGVGRRKLGCHGVGTSGVDDHDGVGAAALQRESIQRLLQRLATAAGEKNRDDSRLHSFDPKPTDRRDGSGAAAKLAALALAQAAPDAETLVVVQRVLEALGLDLARCADLLGVAR